MPEKENIELLINEGIKYLNSQLSNFKLKEKETNFTFKDYMEKTSPNKEIYNILKNSKKNNNEKVIDTINQINSYMYNKKTDNEKTNKALQIVFYQYTNMLESNLTIDSNLEENFRNWCENGNVFYLLEDSEKLSEPVKELCCNLMEQTGKDLDNYTNILSEIYEEEKSKDEESKEDEL